MVDASWAEHLRSLTAMFAATARRRRYPETADMIRQKTVFILGAGASLDYRFPSGTELKYRIIDGLERNHGLWNLLIACGQHPSQLTEFRTLLSQSPQTSIDAFVESRREFVEVAKLACAAELLPIETDNNLDVGRTDREREHWHAYLFQQLLPRTRLDDILQNQLVVLTFNFDRSFERALFRALACSYNEPESRLQNVAQALVPIHVHGSLGEPKWIVGTGLDYGQNSKDPDTIVKAAGNLKLVFDELTMLDRQTIARALDGAKQICFLGFGYHDDNLRKLNLHGEQFNSTVIRGTVKGIPPGRLEVLKSQKFGKTPFHPMDATTLGMLQWLDYLHE